jgi:hypothetical protein
MDEMNFALLVILTPEAKFKGTPLAMSLVNNIKQKQEGTVGILILDDLKTGLHRWLPFCPNGLLQFENRSGIRIVGRFV